MDHKTQVKLPETDGRKRFAEQAGLSISQLKQLQHQANKRETRTRRDTPQEVSFKTVLQLDQLGSSEYNDQVKTSNSRTNPHCSKATKEPKSITGTKALRTSEKHHKKECIPVPQSVDEFYQSYHNYYTQFLQMTQEDAKFIEAKKEQIFQLLHITIQHGGIVSVVSQGQKDSLFSTFISKFMVQTTEQIFSIYKKYLFHFESHLLENTIFKQYHDPTPFFQQATFVEEHDLKEFLDETPLDPKYFKYDILVFKNGQNALGVDSEKINLDRVAENYKNYVTDIRIQKALDYGFKPRTLRNEPYQMKVGDYRTYQKLCQQYTLNNTPIDQNFITSLGKMKDLDVNGTPFKERVINEEIFFGVNFEPNDGLLFDYIEDKVNNTFIGFKQEFDLLSYLDHEVPGCSFPQFYFKVKGVWTGGHQQNVNMCAVNINHGPDASQWYTMEFKYVEEFRAQLKKEFKMDLYAGQGLWYEKLNWFVEQGKFPIKKIIQKKGDIVISGPGTLHWVRSHGIALQSAWNQFPITYSGLFNAFHRQEQNEKIHFIRSNVIPLKRLTLKLLNHPRPQLTPEIKSLCVQKVRLWLSQEQQLFEQLANDENYNFCEQSRFERLDDLQGFCMKCKQEILIYFVNGKTLEDILCLSCYKKEFKGKKKSKHMYLRQSLFDIQALISFTQSGEPFQQIQSFCSAYIGNPPIKCSKNKYKVEKQATLFDKINQMNQELNKCDSDRLKQQVQRMKSKRMVNEKEDQEDQVKDKKQDKMQIEDKPLEQNKIIEEELKVNQKITLNNNVKYLGGRPSRTGWWKFQIPEHLRIVTEENHVQLLKLIEQQQYYVRQKARRNNKPFPSYPYRVYRPRENYQQRYPQPSTKTQQPHFSSDSDTDPKHEQIRKKVHKNQDHKKCGESVSVKELSRKNYHSQRNQLNNESIKNQRQKRSQSKSRQKSKKSSRSKSLQKSSKKCQGHDKEKKRSPSHRRRSHSNEKSEKSHQRIIEEQKSHKYESRREYDRNDERRYDDRRGQRRDYHKNDDRRNDDRREDYRQKRNRNQEYDRNNRQYRRNDGYRPRSNYENEGRYGDRQHGRQQGVRQYDRKDHRNQDRTRGYYDRNYDNRPNNRQGDRYRNNRNTYNQGGYQSSRNYGNSERHNNNYDNRKRDYPQESGNNDRKETKKEEVNDMLERPKEEVRDWKEAPKEEVRDRRQTPKEQVKKSVSDVDYEY